MNPLEARYWGAVVEEVGGDEWLALRRLKVPSLQINGYTYSHEGRCNGKIVAVLPYRITAKGHEVLLRTEIVPPWGLTAVPCAITGGCDHEGEEPAQVALRELEEEAGYAVPPEYLISLGDCRGTKSTDTTFYLFTCDVSQMIAGEAKGDGSHLEEIGGTLWTQSPEKCKDPLVGTMALRLIKYLLRKRRTGDGKEG